MKILTVAIPCYNSQDYMDKAINSLLICKEDIEIIIVDDGSTDDTARIADEFEAKYPSTIRCIHQENGGHGAAVNTGLRNATGLYYKVLDSDDWFDQAAFVKLVITLKKLEEEGTPVDMFVVNYIYDKPSEDLQRVIRYTNALPQDRVFGWHNIKHFMPQQNLLMHSVIYRTSMLRECGLELPSHTFYVDNLFVYEPLPYVHTMYYLDIDLYHYFIGRGDQSVNEQVMIGRIDQQIAVNKRMIDLDIMNLKSRKMRAYMVHYLTMISTVTTVLLVKGGLPEHQQKREELWAYMKEQNPRAYKAVRGTLMGTGVKLMHGSLGDKILAKCYSIAQKIFGFN